MTCIVLSSVSISLAVAAVVYARHIRRMVRAVEKQKRAIMLRTCGRYTISMHANGLSSITCHDCGMTSWSGGDVSHRYCAKCRRFHNDPPNMPPV